jgi:Na+/H+ antiporter NhaA
LRKSADARRLSAIQRFLRWEAAGGLTLIVDAVLYVAGARSSERIPVATTLT